MADYARYMSKYADACEKFNQWESADMNDAETAYYIDVQARVSKSCWKRRADGQRRRTVQSEKIPRNGCSGGFCTGSGYPCSPFAQAQAGSALPAFSLRCGSTAATAPKSTDGSTHAKPSSNSGSLCRNVSGTP